MTDSIPQQAGPGAGADLRRVEHVLWTLLEHNTLHFGDKHSTVTQAREALNEVRSTLSHLAAPLAVEDSRERRASSDARPLLAPAFPREGYVSDAEWAARQRGATQGDIYATRLRAVLEVVQRFLSPDGIDAEAAMGEIVGLVDPWPAAMAAASSGKEN